jgi:hypothetical protein
MNILEMWDHKLFVLNSLSFKFKFIYVVEMLFRILNTDNTVDIVFLHEDSLGNLLQQIKEWKFIEFWNIIVLLRWFVS